MIDRELIAGARRSAVVEVGGRAVARGVAVVIDGGSVGVVMPLAGERGAVGAMRVVVMMMRFVDERVVVVVAIARGGRRVVHDRAVRGVAVVVVVGCEVEVRQDLDAEEPQHARGSRQKAATAASARLPPRHEP